MSKELKDYLHFYIGQKVQVTEISRRFEPHCGHKKGDIVSLSIITLKLLVDGDLTCKLILRILDSMTEEECCEYAYLQGYKKPLQNFKFVNNGFEFDAGIGITWLTVFPPYGNKHKPEQFIYLLSKGFDS